MTTIAHFLDKDILNVPIHQRPNRDGFLNLSNNEFIHPIFTEITRDFLRKVHPEHITGYPDLNPCLQSLAESYGISPTRLTLFPGSDAAIKTVIEALANKPHTRVIFQSPNYHGYQNYFKLYKITPESVPYSDPVKCQASIDPFINLVRETKQPYRSLVILTSPDPFSGFAFSLEDLTRLLEVCQENGALCVLDEAYALFAEHQCLELAKAWDNLILIRSLSKSHGTAGLRFGIVFSSDAICNYLQRWNAHNAISSLTGLFIRHLLDHTKEIETARAELREARDEIVRRLPAESNGKVQMLDSRGNFFAFRINRASAFDYADLCRKEKILIKDLSSLPTMENCYRITTAPGILLERPIQLLLKTLNGE